MSCAASKSTLDYLVALASDDPLARELDDLKLVYAPILGSSAILADVVADPRAMLQLYAAHIRHRTSPCTRS